MQILGPEIKYCVRLIHQIKSKRPDCILQIKGTEFRQTAFDDPSGLCGRGFPFDIAQVSESQVNLKWRLVRSRRRIELCAFAICAELW